REECASRSTVIAGLHSYCSQFYSESSHPFWKYNDKRGGSVYIGHLGPFASFLDCYRDGVWTVCDCYDKNNGGSWTSNGTSINVNFCKW
ncbi:hypothetical protein AJ78_09023, partial [Emergomyces pasteurianus Ep9510]